MDLSANAGRFSGFADHYDRFRPSPPDALSELLSKFTRQARPSLVVDLGCGSGLSSRYWSARSAKTIGIDPSGDMLERARSRPAPNVVFFRGFSHATGLGEGCADIVTCFQSLHWMDPFPTFREIARILRPGGVFAACDYDWPPITGQPALDALFLECAEHSRNLEKSAGLSLDLKQWEKTEHLARMRESGHLGMVRECALHQADDGNAARIVGLLLSQSHVQALLKSGVSENDLGIIRLRETAARLLGNHPGRWFWTCRIRIGISPISD